MIAPSLPTSEVLAHIAQKAGQLTLQYFRKNLKTTEKADNQGLVTEADYASEALIKDFIQKNYPDHAILAEESGLHDATPHKAGAQRPIWIIDPIDGTTNFSKGNPYYCVSIGFGLQIGTRIEVLAGAIHHPPTGDTYTADKGKGSFCNGERLQVSQTGELRLASVVTGFSSNKEERLKKIVESIYELQNHILGLRINGAAALDLAQTARGIFQGFYEDNLSAWDLAAGALIAEEAGALVSNLAGLPLELPRDRSILCAPPALWKDLQKVIVPIFYSDQETTS
jgi:myo-inositol-1(or 4)-monophosphatase